MIFLLKKREKFFKKKYYFHKSFTFIELSIVLLVISLLITAVLSGKTIINNARSIRIMQEILNYRKAINSFYQTYNVLPGDHDNAQYKFAPSGYTTMTMTNIATLEKNIIDKIPLNGDANGVVEANIRYNASIYYSEVYGVWSHLSASRLIDENYSNTCYVTTSNTRKNCSKAGYNLPIIPNGFNNESAFFFYSATLGTEDNKLYGLIVEQIKKQCAMNACGMLLLMDPTKSYPYNNSSMISDDVAFGGGGGVSSDIMMKIDTKMDDGKPLTGIVFGVNGANKDSKKNDKSKEGQCNTYKGSNESNNNIDYDNIVYTNQSHQGCVGIILFNEFNL